MTQLANLFSIREVASNGANLNAPCPPAVAPIESIGRRATRLGVFAASPSKQHTQLQALSLLTTHEGDESTSTAQKWFDGATDKGGQAMQLSSDTVRYVQALAAISHDLQSPITRMKLRAELAPGSPDRDKMMRDLTEIENLIRQGLAFARSAHDNVEGMSAVEIGSVAESVVYDYQDTGRAVSMGPRTDATILTRPHSVRRVLINFVENALKYAGSAEVRVERSIQNVMVISVLDRGPGIPEKHLEAVLEPYSRLRQPSELDAGGTGLGLAIALQISRTIGATLRLRNREGGGLSAELLFN